MKKIIMVLLFCNLNGNTNLFSQVKDSLAQEEIRRFNRLKDSMYHAGLARDSAFQEQMIEALRKTKQSIAESKQKEVEEATKEVLQRQEKIQQRKRNTMLLAILAFLVTVAVAGIVVKRKKQKNRFPQ